MSAPQRAPGVVANNDDDNDNEAIDHTVNSDLGGFAYLSWGNVGVQRFYPSKAEAEREGDNAYTNVLHHTDSGGQTDMLATGQ